MKRSDFLLIILPKPLLLGEYNRGESTRQRDQRLTWNICSSGDAPDPWPLQIRELSLTLQRFNDRQLGPRNHTGFIDWITSVKLHFVRLIRKASTHALVTNRLAHDKSLLRSSYFLSRHFWRSSAKALPVNAGFIFRWTGIKDNQNFIFRKQRCCRQTNSEIGHLLPGSKYVARLTLMIVIPRVLLGQLRGPAPKGKYSYMLGFAENQRWPAPTNDTSQTTQCSIVYLAANYDSEHTHFWLADAITSPKV